MCKDRLVQIISVTVSGRDFAPSGQIQTSPARDRQAVGEREEEVGGLRSMVWGSNVVGD